MSEENKKVFEPVGPNSWDCEGCPSWDDVNGCWENREEYCGWSDEDQEDDQGDEDL